MAPLVPPYIASLAPSVPGKPIEEVERDAQRITFGLRAEDEKLLAPLARSLRA